jgi:hypothetical protein
MENQDDSNVTPITVCPMRTCQNHNMNSLRIILVILTALLLPGGIILLVPVIYKWSKQRKALTQETVKISS